MSDKKIKLILSEPASDVAGGVSQYILAIIRYLPKDEFDVHLAIPGDGPLFDVLRNYGIEGHSLPINYSVWSFPFDMLKLRKFLKKEKFDILHAHTAKAGFICLFASLGLPIKNIYTGHGFRFDQKRSLAERPLFFLFEKIICKYADFMTVLSDSEYDFGIKKGLIKSDDVKTISMSIDVAKFLYRDENDAVSKKNELRIPKDSFVVGMIGRVAFQKDPETFIRVADIVNKKNKSVYFIWIGDGDLMGEMSDLVNILDLGKNVFFVGEQKSGDIPGWLSFMDVVLFTSRFEGLPISLLEAMAAKKNIVAAEVGSIPDIIKNGSTGWTFKSGDFNEAARLVEYIYDNKNQCDTGSKAFEMVKENYSPADKMSKGFAEVYKKVLIK